jgi:hypothetical protein
VGTQGPWGEGNAKYRKNGFSLLADFSMYVMASVVNRGVTSTCLKFGAIFPGNQLPL